MALDRLRVLLNIMLYFYVFMLLDINKAFRLFVCADEESHRTWWPTSVVECQSDAEYR